MTSYYNEIDPYAAQWLRNLINTGEITYGHVDTRSIEDVTPADLTGYTQCHFFAGIGGWSLALRLAGWPDDRPVWTGSCPCQPFSKAGKGTGFADKRHLWPAWQHLIAQCRPPIIFGEQVASKNADAWVDLVHADVENMDYAFGCVPISAAGVGAPHIRDRNFWVADTYLLLGGQKRSDQRRGDTGGDAQERRRFGDECFSGMADTADIGYSGGKGDSRATGGWSGQRAEMHGCCNTHRLAESDGYGLATQTIATLYDPERHSEPCGDLSGLAVDDRRTSAGNSFWSTTDWLKCRDGKWRPAESGTCPLAHGISNRVGRLRAYGNAIVPQVAAEFIGAYLDGEQEQ